MKRIAMVVEGLGDRKAVPSLVAKTALLFDKQVFVSHLVEGGGWDVLKTSGELERNCLLAAADGDPDEIVILVDLDDDCAKTESEVIQDRLAAASAATHLPVRLCFAVREYETWFLEGLEGIIENSPEIDWKIKELSPQQRRVRAAKELFENAMGLSYRQSIDQDKFTKKLKLDVLLRRSRAYRNFAKIISGEDYNAFPVPLEAW